ncbi:MAG: FKBP-type peptidyl-prolyl cis-trans isomerase [Muribaculaceae bacterium]|nr:FKBP-type peptidyl-prolyl cis-trans isomerase [Muribaculaceae bacterium]
MKKLLIAIALIAGLSAGWSCSNDEQTTWDKYKDWRELNNAWLAEMQTKTNPDGTPYYKVIIPEWNPATFVLIHYFNDRAETEGKLSPLYTSFTDTRYKLHDCNGTGIDSSTFVMQTGVQGIYRSQVSGNVQGYAIALMDMRCGDTAEVLVPYGLGYGAQNTGTILPYSNLRFNIRLVDITNYETLP